jgi:hypothetical protein
MYKSLENTGTFDAVVTDLVNLYFSDAEEIGSSDISACVRGVLLQFYENVDEVSNEERYIVRNAVRRAITFI